jgi:hypothetical protein
MPQTYSQRNRPTPTVLRNDMPDHVRKRIFSTLQHVGDTQELMRVDLEEVLSELGTKLVTTYGGLHRPMFEAAIQSPHPVIQHFISCDDAKALDYIELWLKCRSYSSASRRAVDAINEILREEGIGYELTPWVERFSDKPATIMGRLSRSGRTVEVQFPEFIRKDSQFTQAEIVQPCLDVLAGPAFAHANQEMLDAFAKHRRGDFDGALTSCGAAFESVLKTICAKKGWGYDPDKDTLAKLVDICNANGLFPPFYADVFKAVGMVRNKLSDAHGRGPVPLYNVGEDHLQHLIQFVSAHVVFLAKLSGIR